MMTIEEHPLGFALERWRCSKCGWAGPWGEPSDDIAPKHSH